MEGIGGQEQYISNRYAIGLREWCSVVSNQLSGVGAFGKRVSPGG